MLCSAVGTQCSGAGLIAPHFGDRKFAGIVLDDVNLINIGKNSGTENVFSGSQYGILSKNSSVKLLNSDFNDIWDDPITPLKGGCFVITSDYDFSDRSIEIGNGFGSGLCNFYNSIYGIAGFGDMNYSIEKNIFGLNNGSATTGAISSSCIRIEGTMNNNISIYDENKFYDFIKGITLYDIGEASNVTIDENYFYDAIWGSNQVSYNATAISIINQIPYNLIEQGKIENNFIGDASVNYWHSRIGINLYNAGNYKISSNDIYIHPDRDNYSSFCGIQVTNSSDCEVSSNVINAASLDQDLYYQYSGIRVSECNVPSVNCNTLTNMGLGIHYIGDNGQVTMKRNYFIDFEHGIELGLGTGAGANIGQFQGNPNSTNGTSYENDWNSSSDFRVDGYSINPISWYHDGLSVFSNSHAPVDNLGQAIPSIFIIPNADELGPACLTDIWINIRQMGYSNVAYDSMRFEGEYATQFEYVHKGSFYEFISNDTNRLNGGEDDEIYHESFEKLDTSNIGKYNRIIKLSKSNELDQAFEMVENLSPTNDYESYLKTVLNIYLSRKIQDSLYSAADSSVLFEIASLNYLLGGKAVFLARAMLKLEIEDEILNSSRIKNEVTKNSEREIRIQPNPTTGNIYIECSDFENMVNIQIIDQAGRIVSTHAPINYLNLSQLKNGFYIMVFNFSDGLKIQRKLVKSN